MMVKKPLPQNSRLYSNPQDWIRNSKWTLMVTPPTL